MVDWVDNILVYGRLIGLIEQILLSLCRIVPFESVLSCSICVLPQSIRKMYAAFTVSLLPCVVRGHTYVYCCRHNKVDIHKTACRD